MESEPIHPRPAISPLAYSSERPRRSTLHLWIGAIGAMLLEVPWAYLAGSVLWSGMSYNDSWLSVRGVVTLLVVALPSLIAAALVLVAVRRS